MAHEIPEKWSPDQMADYVTDRAASFEALSTLPAEALAQLPEAEAAEEMRRAKAWATIGAKWVAFEDKLEEERKATAAAERDARIKRGRVRAIDTRWDGAVSQLATGVQAASKNNPKLPPYSQLFGTVTVKDARGFGARNASLWGQATARKAAALDDRFGPDAKRLEIFSGMYGTVGDDRDLLMIVRAEAQARRVKLHAQLEDLVAETEQAILELLPRTEAKLAVRALLAPTSSRPGKNRKTEDTEEAIEVEVTDAA